MQQWNWRNIARIALNETLDLIFPPRCQHCGRVDTHFCTDCLADLATLPTDIIHTNATPPLAGIVSSGYHADVLQSAVQILKYGGEQSIAESLAQRIVGTVKSTNWTIDTVVPVPLHTKRLQERGYNQAEVISTHVATLLGLEHMPQALVRMYQTQSQVGLSIEERRRNVQDAFSSQNSILQQRRVLLIDDVRTTGATLVACAQAALTGGAEVVYAVTVTAAQLRN